MAKKSYGNESISSLKGADRVRKRPAVIFGSDGLEGCQHSFFEILSNAIDEAREGHGSLIEVVRHEDHSITVIDHGRGIPVGFNRKEGRHNWELVFCELYAGGKYNNNDGENYEFSLGLNGLGLCATQYSSEYMDVEIKKDGKIYHLSFEKGEAVGKLKQGKYSGEDTGSKIKWRPDLDVFKDNNIPLTYFQDVMKKQAIVNPGVTFLLKDEESDVVLEYIYESGIVDYLSEINGDKALTDIRYYETEGYGRDRKDMDEYKVKIQMAFQFNNEVNALEFYHNSSYLEHGGAPDKAVRSAFVYEIDKFIKTLGKYTKSDKRISFVDIEDSLTLIISSFSTVTSYENQTKKAITNKFIQEFMTEFIRQKLEVYFIENREEAERVIDQILINKRSREKAETTRMNIKKALNSKVDVVNRIKKFVDCRIKTVEKRELYIVEGDSALGACKLARDSSFQALMPVRGKPLNCLKADYNRIFKNDIIVDLLNVLGCGVEIQTKHSKDFNTFNLENLKYGKVILCTDADVDGFQIRTLLLAMIYRLAPTLIREGKVYIAESPLFEISAKGKTYFAYTEKEKQEIVAKIDGKYHLQRSKGLGENEPEMMWQTTMSPETRRLIKVELDDVEKTHRYFETLLGDDLEGRRKLIVDKGDYYMDMLDLS